MSGNGYIALEVICVFTVKYNKDIYLFPFYSLCFCYENVAINNN